MIILSFLKSISILFSMIAGLLAIAIGLYKAVEYIEDKTYAAKKRIEQIIIGVSLFHVILMFRGMSKLLLVYSLVIQYLFFSLLEIYPNIQPSNPTFICGSLMALVNHFLTLRCMILGNFYIVEMVLIFVFGVWSTPFCFFLSLSANDEALPVKGKKTNTWIKRFVSNIIKNK
ncbi:hypothetical protein GVAV_003436 [Gurleya vavrai]